MLEHPAAPRGFAPAEAELEDVVITASRTEKARADAPVATEVISRQEIASSGAENLAELLEEHPGVELERSASGIAVRLEGLEPEHVLFLVDGERVAGRFRGGIDPTRFDLENVAQVEVVKGASSALYGSEAIGGVVNVITRDARRPFESSVRAAMGSRATLDVAGAASGRTERFRTHFSGGLHRSNGYDRDPTDVSTTGAAYHGFDVANRSALDLSRGTMLRLRADYGRLNQTAVDGRPTGAVFDRTQSTEVLTASLGPELRLGDAKLRASLHYSWFRLQILQDQRGATAEDALDDDRQQLGQLTVQYDTPLGAAHLLSAGVEGLLERESVGYLAGGHAGRQRGAVYLQDEWKILSGRTDEGASPLIVVPGVRADLDSQFGARVSPKLAARFDPRADLTLRASFGLGFRAPAFEELYLSFSNPGSGYRVLGNADLRPESAYGLSTGAEYRPVKKLAVGANGFFNRIENLIETDRKPTCSGGQAPPACVVPGAMNEFVYVNVASAETAGLETIMRVGPFAGLSADLGYVLTRTRDLVERRPLPGRAVHKGTAAVSYRDATLGLDGSVRASIVGRRPFFEDLDADGRLETSAPYATLDVRVAKDIFDRLSLFAGAENIFDAGDALLLPIAPRTFYAGITARYDVDRDLDGGEGSTESTESTERTP